MYIDADLHIHGLHSGAVSEKMKVPVIAEQAGIKGLDVIATGDILNPGWRRHVSENTETTSRGFYRRGETEFILSTEVEDKNRVHHLIFLPSMESAENLQKELEDFSKNIKKEGRPRITLSGEDIAENTKKVGGIIGPSHAFTPWTSIYKEHDSLDECYGSMSSEIDFIELGLSADTEMADKIKELNEISFLSNSDAHSPWPDKIGREFNRFQVEKKSFEEFRKALKREKGRKISLNVGFNPLEGKYHCTACQNCHQKYSFEQAINFRWECDICGRSIKKGVKDRVKELSDGGKNPEWRPRYLHLVPLAEIIKEVVGHSSTKTKTVQKIYGDFQSEFNSEINILIDEDIENLSEVNKKVGSAVRKFREGKTIMIPGGGGSYGELVIPRDEQDRKRILEERESDIGCFYSKEQKSLSDF